MASKYKNSLAIVIPMFNEEIVASECIDKVMHVITTLKNRTVLIVVNDGSSDNTKQILDEKAKIYRKKIIVISLKKNAGFGGALQAGIKKALELGFEFYLTMDSDLTNPPKYIPNFIKEMSDEIDCIKASRYIKGGGVKNVPRFRQVISIMGNQLASRMFNVGIKDCTNGFKMVRLELLRGVKFKENNFSIILEELYYLKKKKAKFAEIPNILYVRKNSKSHFRYTPKIFYDYFKYSIKVIFI